MKQDNFATGSRKNASAKVWLIPGQAERSVNDKTYDGYFGRPDLVQNAMAPLRVTGTEAQFGVKCIVSGGGLSAQSGAVALGTARALVALNPEWRKALKDAALLKRDPREKERMKYGLAKRRKRFQWTKR
jgi:small subunit ribosomal protein S9